MLRDLLIIFVIAIVFIVDCGYTVETECKSTSECGCKSLIEDEVDDFVSIVDIISEKKKEV